METDQLRKVLALDPLLASLRMECSLAIVRLEHGARKSCRATKSRLTILIVPTGRWWWCAGAAEVDALCADAVSTGFRCADRAHKTRNPGGFGIREHLDSARGSLRKYCAWTRQCDAAGAVLITENTAIHPWRHPTPLHMGV